MPFKYRGKVIEKDKMFIFFDGQKMQINQYEFEFHSSTALTYEEVKQKLAGTEDLLVIAGDFIVKSMMENEVEIKTIK